MASSALTRSGSAPQLHVEDKLKRLKKDEFFGGASRITRSSSTSSSFFNGGKKTQKQGRCAFTRKCVRLVNEQRARFYIIRRCVIMLICWRDNYTDS